MKFFTRVRKIPWDTFIFEYLENKNTKKEFSDFVQKSGIKNPTESQRLEFIIFDLFIDYAIFLTRFSKTEAQLLLETLEANLLFKLIFDDDFSRTKALEDKDWLKKTDKDCREKLETRFNEYLPCLEEFTPEGLKNWNPNNHFGSALGQKFSKNFTGDEKHPLVHPATFLFLSRLKAIGNLLKSIEVSF